MIGIGEKIITYTNLYFNEHGKEAKAGNLVFEEDQENGTFAFFLFDKIVENFSAIGEMMKASETKSKSYLRNSIYILIRSGLYDSITLMWLFESTDEEMELRAHRLRSDHIKYHVSQMKKMEGLGLLPADEKNSI